MGLGDRQVVRGASFLDILPQRQAREQQAADDADALKEGKPIVTGPFQKPHAPHPTTTNACPPGCAPSDQFEDIRLRTDQRGARNFHDALIRPATGGRRQMTLLCLRDVLADNCNLSVRQLKNVRAAAQRLGLRAIGVRVGAKTTFEHD